MSFLYQTATRLLIADSNKSNFHSNLCEISAGVFFMEWEQNKIGKLNDLNFRLRNAKEINLESLSVMNLGLDKSNFWCNAGVSCRKFGTG